MTKDKKESRDIKSYLKKVGIATEKGGSLFTNSVRLAGTVKGASIKFANRLKKAMKAKNVDVISLKRVDLINEMGNICMEPPGGGKPPTIKHSVREHLRARGIRVKSRRTSGIVDFYKAETKKY